MAIKMDEFPGHRRPAGWAAPDSNTHTIELMALQQNHNSSLPPDGLFIRQLELTLCVENYTSVAFITAIELLYPYEKEKASKGCGDREP